MKSLYTFVIGLALTVGTSQAAERLTVDKATALATNMYSMFNFADRPDIKGIYDKVLSEDYQSCNGYLPTECSSRDAALQGTLGFAQLIPDMRFTIKEVLVSGDDRVIVRGEVKGTPAGDFFGVPHSGKSFDIMTIDILTVREGKVSQAYHMENWLSALNQLSAK